MKDFIEANDLREMAQQIIDSEKDFVLIDLEKVEFCRIKQQTKQGEHLFKDFQIYLVLFVKKIGLLFFILFLILLLKKEKNML